MRTMTPQQLFPDGLPRHMVPGDEVCDGEYIAFETHREIYDAYGDGIDYLGGSNMGSFEVNVFTDYLEDLYCPGHYFNPDKVQKGPEHPDRFYTAKEFYTHYKNLLGDLYIKYDFENLVKVTDETAWISARWMSVHGLCPVGRRNIAHSLMTQRLFAEYIAKKNPGTKSFVYLFAHPLPDRPQDKGTYRDSDEVLAFHGSELYFAFNSMRENIPPARPWRENDYAIADQMCSYWVNFMKTGDPNGEGLVKWPQASDGMGYLMITDKMEAHHGEGDTMSDLTREWICSNYGLDF